ncbi:Alpha-2-HS-glycoprotein [Liparis tanakae]|uniref:Alpha-2-HS-glycoprotein n=1 Tax=Liparis tanakae TaxID=230148 RepID=A0A4Z2E2P2_9TELE|nr:Alpha-2-HS-glycoprotein [Liparis tanakae]
MYTEDVYRFDASVPSLSRHVVFALCLRCVCVVRPQGPAGNVYYLDLDVLETKCPIGSPKPWKRCDVRPFMETQISGICNTTMLLTPEGYSYLYSYDCTLVPDLPEKLQQTCPTCPTLLPVESPQAVAAAQVTLASYKRRSAVGAGLGVKKITRAAARVYKYIYIYNKK